MQVALWTANNYISVKLQQGAFLVLIHWKVFIMYINPVIIILYMLFNMNFFYPWEHSLGRVWKSNKVEADCIGNSFVPVARDLSRCKVQ